MMKQNVRGRHWAAGSISAPALALVLCWAMTAGMNPLFAEAGTQASTRSSASSPVPAKDVTFANGFSSVAKKVLPAVVNIASSKIVRNQNQSSMFSEPFFRQFFGNIPSIPKKQIERSLGSGVIVSADGYIMTNNHVVGGASEIEVSLQDGRSFKATIVGTDPMSDIAIVKVNAANLPTLPLGNSDKVEVGDFAIAFGNPFGLKGTVTMGIISAKGRTNLGIEGENGYEDFIQTDASINPGNSGGALVNIQGELIAINTAIITGGGGGNEGIGFAIPINMAHLVMDEILKNGRVIRGYLGVIIQPMTPELAKAFSLPKAEGILIGDVEPNSPAAKAGLHKGDIILQMNGKSVVDMSDFRLAISMLKPGTVVTLKIFRNGSETNMPVTLGELPAQNQQQQTGQQGPEPPTPSLEGLTVDNLTPDIAAQLGLPKDTRGVVVTNVDAGSAAATAGIHRGDVIQEVDKKPVYSVDEFDRLMAPLRKQNVLLLINRGGKTMYVVVSP